MQLQGLMFALFMLVVIPLLMLSSNHNVFFAIMAFALILLSFRRLYLKIFQPERSIAADDEFDEDQDDMLDVNMKKFDIGTKVAKDLILILFLFYCMFYTQWLWLKAMSVVIMLYWLRDIVLNVAGGNDGEIDYINGKVKALFSVFIDLGTVTVIVIVMLNKFTGSLI